MASGVTDALLDELITINRDQADSLRKLAGAIGSGGGGAGGTGGGSGGSAGNPTVAGKVLSGTFNAMGAVVGAAAGIVGGTFSVALGVAGKGLQALTQAGTALWQNQKMLAEGAIEGTNSLASLTAGLENLPFGLGLVAEVMTYQAKKLEKNIATYQAISDAGATLGGNLNEVRRSAAGMYLSMDEFARVMKENVSQLKFFGGVSGDGAKALIKFNSTMIKGDVGRQLLGMGYSLEEANNMIGSYSQAVGGLKAEQLKDQKQMEASVKFFAEELDAAAQLEGKTRKQKEEEMKEASAQAAVRAKLAEMGPEEQKKYLAAYNAALRIGGKGAAEALQSQLLGLPPMTKAAQQFTAVNGEAAQTVGKLANTITDGTSALEARSRQDRLAAEGVVQSGNRYKELGQSAAALSMQNAGMAETINASANNYADNMNQGIKNADDAERRIQNVRERQQQAQESQIGATVQAQGAMKHFGGLMDMLAGALEPLFPVVMALVKGFAEILPKVISFGSDVITKIIIPVFQDLFGGISFDDVLKPFKDFFSGLFGSGEGATTMEGVRKGLTGFLKPITTFIGDIITAIDWKAVGGVFRTTFQTIGNVIQGIANIIGTIFGGDGGNFGKGLQEAFERLASIVNRIVAIVQNIVDTASSTPIFENMKEFFLKLFDVAFQIAEAILNIIESPIGQWVIGALGIAINGLFEMFNAVLDVISGIVSVVEGIFDILSGDFSEGFQKIYDGVGGIIGGIVDFIGSILSTVVSLVGSALGYIFDLLTKMINGIVQFFIDLWNTTVSLLASAYQWVVDAITGMVNAVVDGFVSLGNGIINFFSGSYDEILGRIWNAITGIFDAIVDGIKNLAGDVVNKVKGWFSDEEEPAPAPQPQQQRPQQQQQQRPQQQQQRPPAPRPAPEPRTPPRRDTGDLGRRATDAGRQAEQRRMPPMSDAARNYQAQNAAAAQQLEGVMDATRTPGRAGQTAGGDAVEVLNRTLPRVVSALTEIADSTKRTANAVTSGGNMFRR